MKKDQSFGIIPIFIDETDKPHFLIVQHSAGHWSFPKGHSEEGESPKETALRELKEETGIVKCDILETSPLEEEYIISKHIETAHKKKGERILKTVTLFLGKIYNTSVTIKNSSEEIVDYMWLPYETAHERITYLESKHALTQAFQYITNTKL